MVIPWVGKYIVSKRSMISAENGTMITKYNLHPFMYAGPTVQSRLNKRKKISPHLSSNLHT